MGNSVSRPSCLGEKSPRCEDFLKAPGLAARNNEEEDRVGPLERAVLSPRVIENGWNVALEGAGKGSPLPKQNNVDVKLQNCPPLKAQLAGAVTPLGSGWGRKPRTTREVTEVTEVTETVVTEIVEVTEFPGGDGSQEALVTRMVKVLADFRGALPEAATFPGGVQSAGLAQETAGKLLAWVSEVEDLVAHQKPPSGEARVVKAQLQEQKLLLRLLEERMSHVGRLRQPLPAEPVGAAEGQEEPRGLASLQEKWAILVQEAEARHSSLQKVLPAANVFQESVDSFQAWLGFTERMLAQLWRAQGSLAQSQEAHRQIQDLCKEIQSKPAELEEALEHGQHLWEMVPGEEAQLVQGKMDSLRMRLLVVGQRSSDILQRLEQALEASSHLDPAQEDLALWLERMEKGQSAPGGQPGEGPCPLPPADRDKLEQRLRSELAAVALLSSRLEELSQVPLNAQAIRLALAEQKRLSAESLLHRGVAERLVGVADPLLSSCPAEIQERFQPLVRPLQERVERLDRQSSACALQLERAQLLLAQPTEAQAELPPWLEEAQRTAEEAFSPSSVGCEAFREQQEVLQRLREAMAEHKPLVATLLRVTTQLAELCPREAAPLWQSLQAAEEQYASLRERVRRAAAMLGEAVPRYSQLSEQMELVAGCLERVQDRGRHPPALRGDPLWLQEQLWENRLRLVELEELGVALETLRGQGAELPATLRTTAHPAVQERVRELQDQWQVLWKQEEEREASLRELLALAGRFWPGLAQQMALDLEGTAASDDPKDVRARLVAMQALREEADALQSRLDSLGARGTRGTELMSLCGDLEKPAVAQSLEDLCSSWNSLNKMWEDRQRHLEDRRQACVRHQETMEGLLAWLEEAEQRVAEAFLGGGDLAQVKRELSELEAFKRDLYQRQEEAESLWHQSSRRGAAQEDTPLAFGGFRDRWTRLEEELVARQLRPLGPLEHRLEATLLGLGQFQSQLEGLLQWLLGTTEQLRSPAPLTLDLRSCEIELATHQVLRKDVLSHTLTVQSVQEAGRSLRPPSGAGGGSADGLQGGLRQLSRRWSRVLAETENRQLDLERHLSQVREVALEITGLTQWLDRVELQLFSPRPIWGRPEATEDELAAQLELCEEMDSKRQTYQQVREKFRHLLAACRSNRASGTEHSLMALEQKWGSITSRVRERKEQLLQSLDMATEFHAALQELLEWIGQTEAALAALPPPSYILDTLSKQRQRQQALATETEARSKKLAGMEVAHPKQDDGAPRSPVGAARERLAEVRRRVGERGEALEEAHRQAEQLAESWQLLLQWLDEVEAASADDDATARQEDVKVLLGQHQEFQKRLHVKRPAFEAALRRGCLLRAKALLPADGQELDEMLGGPKERWGALWSWAAERQRKLEEHLLFSGRFSDALQTLLDWLYRVEPQLAEETPVAGDRDLVGALMEKHKAFQKELGQRAVAVRTLRCSVHELAQGGGTADTQWLQVQMEELGRCWELVGRLSVSKQDRLEVALRQAEEFHRLVHSFLGRLSELEKSVTGDDRGLPEEEEEAVAERQSQLKELQQSVQCQQLELECISSLGEEILSACHPDAVGTVHSWVALAQNRFQQLRSQAQWQEQRLQAHAASRAADQEEVERLGDWISAAEESLSLRDQEPLPEDAGQLAALRCQHTGLMQELDRKQPEVEKVTESCRRKRTSERGVTASLRKLSSGWHGASTAFPRPPPVPLEDPEPQSPLLAQLGHRWQRLWLAALDRQHRLQSSQQRLQELEELASFDFVVWRKRYLQWISQRKSRVLDVFRSIDRDQDGRITRQEFVGRVLASKFPTSLPEVKAAAKMFDVDKDGFIDYYEFISALHPGRDTLRRAASADQIQEEMNRQVAQCNCVKRFQVEQISSTRYRFGESQQLRMVRILRSTLMVRVGGGWTALDEFLVKNDPCRVQGRTNLKINEKYLSPGLMGRKGVGSQSAPTSKVLSPSGSTSSLGRYGTASAPGSPVPRKAVLRRTRSGDRCLPSRSSGATGGAGLAFATGAAGPDAEPPGHPRRDPAPSDVAAT